MTDPNLLLEMFIVGFIGIVSICFGLIIYIKHKEDKGWDKARWVLMAAVISVGIMVTIFEIVWLCMYLGLPV
jgi:hypothetical protein